MKVAIISDIHGNLEALMAIEKDMLSQGVERIYCLGDVVGYGPFPGKCLQWTVAKGIMVLKGNHEYGVCNQDEIRERFNRYAFEAIQFSGKQLSDDEIIYIDNLPLTAVVQELDFSLSHSSFWSPEYWVYVQDAGAAKRDLGVMSTRIGFLGHTHIPFVFGSEKGLCRVLPDRFLLNNNERFIINVGSVGQPRDGDCRASYGILEYDDDGSIRFDLRRVSYDIFATEWAMVEFGLPFSLHSRLFEGK
ncbi:metallophosphoesterase family protein [Patescibacteria group bacterium]